MGQLSATNKKNLSHPSDTLHKSSDNIAGGVFLPLLFAIILQLHGTAKTIEIYPILVSSLCKHFPRLPVHYEVQNHVQPCLTCFELINILALHVGSYKVSLELKKPKKQDKFQIHLPGHIYI